MKRLALAFCLFISACATSPGTTRVASNDRSEVERYFPLIDGHIYTYEITTDNSPSHEMFMLKVRRSSSTSAELRMGSTLKALTVSPTAIARLSGGFVLKSPLVVGTQWPGDNGATVRITEIGLPAKVPAGSFSNCLKTVQAGSTVTPTVTTIYCPDVGIVEMSMERLTGSSLESEHVQLRSFGAPIDLK
jgi:hypothetical protein